MTGRKSENISTEPEIMAELSLGQALAVLDAQNRNPNGGEPAAVFFTPVENAYLHLLRERRQALSQHPHLVQHLFDTIPEHGCDREYSFLADTIDVFLVYLTNLPHAAQESAGEFAPLFRHMNNCFLCFEEYGLVLRDYWRKSQELRGNGDMNTDY